LLTSREVKTYRYRWEFIGLGGFKFRLLRHSTRRHDHYNERTTIHRRSSTRSNLSHERGHRTSSIRILGRNSSPANLAAPFRLTLLYGSASAVARANPRTRETRRPTILHSPRRRPRSSRILRPVRHGAKMHPRSQKRNVSQIRIRSRDVGIITIPVPRIKRAKKRKSGGGLRHKHKKIAEKPLRHPPATRRSNRS
jgi:hypothetical protein